MPRRRFLAAMMAAFALMGAGAVSALGEGQPRLFSVPADARARMEAQRPAVQAATEIRDASESAGDRGFSGIRIRGGGVVVYKDGALNPRASAEVAEARREGVKVSVREARYSLGELERAMDRATAWMRAHPESAINSAGIDADGSALTLTANGPVGERPDTGVATTIVQRAPLMPRYSRAAATSPFWAGALMFTSWSIWKFQCTAGWPVSKDNVTYILTAGHCVHFDGSTGSVYKNGDGTLEIGPAVQENVGHDTALIRASSAGYIFDGGPTTAAYKPIKSVRWDVFAGEEICQSGSTSGTVCGLVNTGRAAVSYCWQDPTGFNAANECYSDLVESNRAGGGGAAGGDSGGPVYTIQNGVITAVGILSGASADGTTIVYQDLLTAYNDFGGFLMLVGA